MRGMFSSVGKTRCPSRGLTSREALALLLVLALFVCDGAFGATLHKVTNSVEAGDAGAVAALPTDGESALGSTIWLGATAAGADAPSHLAAVLFLHLVSHVGNDEAADTAVSVLGHVGALLSVLSAVFLPWLGNVPKRRQTLLPGPLFWGLCPARLIGLGSRPTIPALQVFRL
jgi:hypothetical protein